MTSHEDHLTETKDFRDTFSKLKESIAEAIVGQEHVIEATLTALICGGNVLLEGVPGLGKTELAKAISQVLDLEFRRIQFTPDLMPADIVGSEIIDVDQATGQRQLRFVPGPVFTHVLLADEINRTPPKTQAALLVAMEERQVSAGGQTRPLPPPFYVFATQNPIELEGTYPLPEAQLDRFMFNIHIGYLSEDEELQVATQTTSGQRQEIEPVFTGADMLDFARLVRLVPVAEPVARYAVRLVQASRPGANGFAFVENWVNWGAGTRASQALLLGAKARALLAGRLHVACADIRALAPAVLRHRILCNFRAEADGIGVEDIIAKLLEAVPEMQIDAS